MRLVRRCVTPGRLGLVVGTLALAGCVVPPYGYDYPQDDHYLYGYGQYAAAPPGYYWWYPRPYGPSGYPPPIVVVRDDHDRHDHGKGPKDGRGNRGERDRDRDRDRDGATVDPLPSRVLRPGESRTAPLVVPEDGEQPAPIRRRSGSRPQSPLPEE